MGYMIYYGKECEAEHNWNTRSNGRHKRRIIAAVIICAALLAAAMGKTDAMQNLLIPGNPEVTKAAFAQFSDDIRNGEHLDEAITAFCREIINHAVTAE